ncbi:MAG: TolC family protein [Ghiorsea sp.]|nr:TolC family protein [Ghiorsea sp.]
MLSNMKNLGSGVVIAALVMTFMTTPTHAGTTITSLKGSVYYALENNRNLAVSASRVTAAEAQVDAATGQLLPRLDLSTGFYRTNSPLNSFGTILQQQQISTADFDPAALNNPAYTDNYMTRLGLTMPLYTGGALYAARNKASANMKSASLQVQFQQQLLVYQTIAAYVQSRQALAQVGAQANAVKAAEQRLSDAKALKKRGMAIASDVMDAHVYVLRSQLALDNAQHQYENSLENLRLVLGMDNEATLGQLQEPFLHDITASLSDLLAEAPQQRADLLVLIQQKEAASASTSQAKSGYMPHVNLTAASEWHSETLGLNNVNNSIGLTVSMNLFAGGSDSAQVRAAEAASIGLALQQEDKRQQIANEIRQAWRSLNMAKNKLRSESEAYKQTTESLRIKALRHKQGLETTSDLLASQVRTDQAQVMLIRAKYDVLIAKAALLLAAGTLNEGAVQ